MPHLCTLEEFLADLHEQQLGQRITYAVGSNDGAGGSRRVCGFSAPHHLARPWAISLGPPNRGLALVGSGGPEGLDMSQDQNEAVALLTWGTGGFMNTMQIDWRQGGIYTVVGSAVEVACRMPVVGTLPLQLGASITPCSYQVPNNATRTLRAPGAIPSLGEEFFTVPAGARRVTAFPVRNNPLTRIPYTLEFFRANNVEIGTAEVGLTVTNVNFHQAIPIPVPFQAAFIRFINQNTTTTLNGLQLIFELAF